MGDGRKGDWIQTRSGRKFWILDPRVEDIDLEDIAQALSKMCRFGCHSNVFYSVAQHSVETVNLCESQITNDKETLKAVLLHDASEAYHLDIPRPMKRNFPQLVEVEKRVRDVIFTKFNLQPFEKYEEVIKYVDNALLIAEARTFMNVVDPLVDWGYSDFPDLKIEISPMLPKSAYACFMYCYNKITGI